MKRRYWLENVLLRGILFTAACLSILIVALIFAFLFKEAAIFAKHPGLAEIAQKRWIPVSFQRPTYGMIPLLTGSFLVTFLAILFATPFGVCGAVYISEIARPKEREILKPFVELLAGIPSVVIGFFGLAVLAPFMKNIFSLSTGLTALTGALLLALMAIPTIISIAEDAVRNVPQSYKDASLALGANLIQTTWRVVVPAALPGIIAAILLGVGRVIGETMVVLMVTGNSALITANPLNSVRTMTATIAAEMGEVAFGDTHYSALFCVGAILLIFTFILNMIAQRALRYQAR